MTIHGDRLTRTWIVPVFVLLIAGHLIVPYMLSHVGLSVVVVWGLAVVAAKHLGLLAMLLQPVFMRLRRRRVLGGARRCDRSRE